MTLDMGHATYDTGHIGQMRHLMGHTGGGLHCVKVLGP